MNPTNPTPKEFRKLWVETLRSGKFLQQDDGALSTPNGYCCLGVACELYNIYFDDKLKISEGYCLQNKAFIYDGERNFLPEKVRIALSIRTNKGDFNQEENDPSNLTLENDLRKKNFNQIADIIESEPEGLFVK